MSAESIHKKIIEPITDTVGTASATVSETAAQVTTNITANISESPIPMKTMDHLYSYPLVQQTTEFIGDIPAVRILNANLLPLIDNKLVAKAFTVVKPCTTLVDNMGEKSLQIVDKVVPSLKEKTYQKLGEEVAYPYTYTKETVQKGTQLASTYATEYCYEPVHSRILGFRKFYNEKLYDTKGKPLIRGSLDPFVGPINGKLEQYAEQYLPKGNKVSTDGFSNEVDRSFAIVWNALGRLIPATEQKVGDIVTAPCQYTKHVCETFNHNLDQEKDLGLKNSFNASKKSVQELEKEIVDSVKEHNPLKSKTEKKKESLLDSIMPTAAA